MPLPNTFAQPALPTNRPSADPGLLGLLGGEPFWRGPSRPAHDGCLPECARSEACYRITWGQETDGDMCITHCCQICFNCRVGELLISPKHSEIVQQFLRDWKWVADLVFYAEIVEAFHTRNIRAVCRLGQALPEEVNRPLQVAESQS